MKKLIFNFSSKELLNSKKAKSILGGKGANLAEMGKLGLPVPPGFTISTEVCELFYKNKKKLNTQIILSLIHISEPTRHLRISYAVFCLKKKTKN